MMTSRSSPAKIPRFSFAERAVHWLTAISFLYAALTGLALWTPHLYWLASVFGGGNAVRWGHPWGGVFFAVVLALMFRSWAAQMRLDADDRVWLRKAHKYAMHEDAALPEAGRFNAGQKMLFWLQSVSTVALVASGLVLWWPETMPRAFRLAAVLVHPLAAICSIGGIIVHIYMGTAAVPEAFRGMIQGWVRPGWAAAHHPKWYREISKR
ncbi:MAG: formate dehydrogenase subunit gamma [Bryobacteraceae bacterium]